MDELTTLLLDGWRTHLVAPNEILMTSDKLSLASVLNMVTHHGARLGIKNGQPSIKGAVPPHVLDGLSQHRDAIRELLLAGLIPEAEGLVCSRCEIPGEPATSNYRFCSEHGVLPHWRKQ